MADIEIVYEYDEGCDADMLPHEKYCIQCRMSIAEDRGCKSYLPYKGIEATDANGTRVIPYGDCARAYVKYARKGWSGKNYEIEPPLEDEFNPHLNCVGVRLGKEYYEKCVKVILNGKVIYNNYDDEKVSK